MNPHRLDVTLNEAGSGGADWKLTCAAPVAALCRLWCGSGCDEYCTDPETHPKVDQGFCLPVTWIDNDDGPEYDFGGDKDTPVRSGPVIFTWDGDNWLWDYDDEQEALDRAGQALKGAFQ